LCNRFLPGLPGLWEARSVLILAESSAWVGVAGTAVGGLIGFAASWLVHRSERAERAAEKINDRVQGLDDRSRAEKKEAYAAFLTRAEDSMHLFQFLTDDATGPPGTEDKAAAIKFYDQEVVPRYRMMELIGAEKPLDAAHSMRVALNDIRRLIKRSASPVTKNNEEFKTAHTSYRRARDAFLDAARADLT
jgi:hypothetical protein